MPVKKNREYRALALLTPQATEKRIQTDSYVEGYAAKFEPYVLFERDGVKVYEQIHRDAFVGADMSDVIMQYDHEGRVLARQSNGSLIVEVDDTGLFVAANLDGSTASRELFQDIDKGLVTKMSWAFTVAAEEYDKESRTRIIKRINKVYDVSAVSIPANGDTNINARSFFDGVIEVEQQELLKRKKQALRIKHKLTMEGF